MTSPAARLRRVSPFLAQMARWHRRGLVIAGGLALVHRLALLALPFCSKLIVDDVASGRRIDRLALVSTLLAAAALAQAVTAYAATVSTAKLAHTALADLRERLMAHAVHLPLEYLDRLAPGALPSRVQHSLEGVTVALTRGFVELIGTTLLTALVLPLLLHIDAVLTAIVVAFAVVFGALLLRGVQRSKAIFRTINVVYAGLNGALNEIIAGIRVVKTGVTEDAESARYARRSREMLDVSLRSAETGARFQMASEAMRAVAIPVLVYVGSQHVAHSQLTLGQLAVFGALVAILLAPVASLISLFPELLRALAVLDDAQTLLARPREGGDESNAPVEHLSGALAFEDVWFEHHPGRPVLRGVTFAIEPGTTLGIVGPSGAGKSTLIDLVARLREPTAGRVVVDGMDAREVALDTYRRHVGIVGQEVFLFDRSVRANVAYGRPDASDQEVIAACESAQIDGVVADLPRAYATPVGERGATLSGGERQRLAIARALLTKPAILLLDEATASIDAPTEAAVQRALITPRRTRTTVIVAHRLSTVRHADLILVLDRGAIVERGTHEALMALGGTYYSMVARQLAADQAVASDTRP